MNGFISFILIVLGITNIIAPKIGWYLSHGMHYKDAEPSDASLILGRLGGDCYIFNRIF
ncbi:DUF6199 family natural product biosynthesis protein [Thermohalobacter berrensis]|uniref:DUF6199 family natural product biosynthesis protein n=1 Tax=Thermohalobacter berrensis TaxID=99594 RepID=UPI0016030958|nr:DUF6199 family natural product biosynthesis protein [Thermohalobacter berrensis]